jgi:CubicO group peptidase (beta-lactamase class C family)
MFNLFIRAIIIFFFIGLFESHICAAEESRKFNTTCVEIQINSKTDSLIKSLPGIVKAVYDESGLPSLSIAIVYDRDIIYSQAFGFADQEKKISATTGTIYPIASITKLFTATMLVQLSEKGVVSLDTPVKNFLPEYKVKSPYNGTQPTTLRQLATHTSGLPKDANVSFQSDYAAANWIVSMGSSEMKWYASKEEVLTNLPDIELEYPPNSRYSYSNLGMCLLGIALERAACQSYTEYIETKILKPLGMDHSGFFLQNKKFSSAPIGYVYVDSTSKTLIAPEWELGAALYTGGLYSTAEDLARFLSLQFQNDTPGELQIISADGLRMMHLESIGWGIGWGRYPVIEHTGGHLGFYAYIRAIPKLKIGIAALTNSHNPLSSDLPSRDIAQYLLDQLKQAMLTNPATDVFNPDEIDLNQYAGDYHLPGTNSDINIELRKGQLYAILQEDSTFNYPLNPIEKHQFGIEDDTDPWFTFQVDDEGKIKSLKFIGFTFKKLSRFERDPR